MSTIEVKAKFLPAGVVGDRHAELLPDGTLLLFERKLDAWYIVGEIPDPEKENTS
jgi:hypothetical protein